MMHGQTQIKYSLFLDVTHRRFVVISRCFGTTYRLHLIGLLVPLKWDLWFSRNVGK